MAFTMQLPERHATSLAGSRLTVGSWDYGGRRPFSAAPPSGQARPPPVALDQAGPARPGHWQGPRLGRSPPAYGVGLRLPEKPRNFEFKKRREGPAGRGSGMSVSGQPRRRSKEPTIPSH